MTRHHTTTGLDIVQSTIQIDMGNSQIHHCSQFAVIIIYNYYHILVILHTYLSSVFIPVLFLFGTTASDI